MRKPIAALAVCIFFFFAVDRARSSDDDGLEKFVATYHRKPAPERVPEMLAVALKRFAGDPNLFDAPNASTLIAQAFGYMAKGQPKLVRLYESHYEKSDKHGQRFLLASLRICGDAETVKRLEKWASESRDAQWKKQVESAHAFLADPKREYARDRAAKSPEELDLLWADFLITGEYAPIARLLDVLEQPQNLREIMEKRLKRPLPDSAEGPEVLANLKLFNLLEPNTKDKLIKGDLELALLYDRKGRLRGNGLVLMAISHDLFDLKDEGLVRAMATHGAAAWSLRSNAEQHPRLTELLKAHYRDCKPRSQELVKRWLQIDQQFQLSEEAKKLQGTWQAFAEERKDDKADPKLTAEILKYVRWTFDEDECRSTKARTVNSTKVVGQGGTNFATFEIDATANPKRMVFTSISGNDWMKTYPCIYQIEGDVLTVCMSTGKDFPRNFSAESGVITKLKRMTSQPAK